MLPLCTDGEGFGMSGENTNRLTIQDVSLYFGELTALDQVSFGVAEHEILAIIGPNGAGKTSLFNCITGFYRPQKGRILFNHVDITTVPRHKIAGLGIARTFQNLALYEGLSPLENLMAARHIHMKGNPLTDGIFLGWARREEVKHREIVEALIDFLEIQNIRKQVVANLPYGLRKRVDLGRALALEPNILLLDEPMAGMNVEEKEDMARFILDIYRTRKIPIVLVEHDMALVMDIADKIVVLEYGIKIAEGQPRDIVRNPQVIKAYLGEESSAAL